MPSLQRIGAPSDSPAIVLAVDRPVVFRSKQGLPAARVEISASGKCRVTATRGTTVLLNGVAISDAPFQMGDELIVGRDHFRLLADAPEVVEPDSEAAPAPANDRVTRRLSATHLSPVAKASTSGLLTKVSAAFNSKDKTKLANLELERRQLLSEAGLASLTGGGIGLAHDKLTRILRGEELTLAAKDLDPVAIEHWRRRRRRLSELDSAIDALRAALGLPPSPDRMVGTPQSGQVPSAAAALADMGTQQITPAP